MDYIERACRARNQVLRPGQDPAFAGLWEVFTRYMMYNIRYINEMLSDTDIEGKRNEIFQFISVLIAFDCIMQKASWRAHMNGFLAYMEFHGGVRKLLAQPRPPGNSICANIPFCISANTTCLATQQCMAIYRLSDEDIEAITSLKKGCVFLQCPGRVQLAIFRLSELRLPVFRKVNAHQDMCDKIQCISEQLDNVNLEAWATEYCSDADRAVTAANIARIMVAAARLYGILALPKTWAGPWIAASPIMQHTVSSGTQRHLDAYNRTRVWHRERLLELLRAAEKYLLEPQVIPGGVVWALFVAGVAASDGSEESRGFIKSTLTRFSQGPIASPCFRACAERLDAVWRQGLIDWEECVSEPLMLFA